MTAAALLAALALAQAAPPAQAAPAPATPAAAAEPASDLPAGAPTDDYGLVAWCRGALAGHMELYKSVKPEMTRLEQEKAAKQNAKLTGEALAAAKARQAKDARDDDVADAAQMKAGRDYLALYTKAMNTAEASGPDGLHARGEEAASDGYRVWAAARAADPRTRMWSWLLWELPHRCEISARRLQANAGLFGEAYKGSGEPAAPAPSAGATSDAPPAASSPAPPQG